MMNLNNTTYTDCSASVSAAGSSGLPDRAVDIEAFHERIQRLYPCVEDVSKLPQCWSLDSKAPPLGLLHNNLGCYFRVNGRREDDEKSAASVRTDHYIPPSCLLYYFEIKFLSKGREGYMGVGLTSSSVPLCKLPGWTAESYGYHADDGNTFNGDGRGHPYGPTFTTGDVIGCGYNLVEGKCFFTKNGLNLGKAFDDMPSEILLYPTIGLKTPGEEVHANFGQEDFVYDIEQDLRSLRKNMTLTISNYPITDFSNWQNSLHRLVQSWLSQNSYPKTLEAFSRTSKLDCKENVQRIKERNRVQQMVLSGRISEAIRLTNKICPGLLDNNPNLLFALKCRQFIELISGAESNYQPSSGDSDIGINHHTNGIVRMDANGGDLPDISKNNGCNGMIAPTTTSTTPISSSSTSSSGSSSTSSSSSGSGSGNNGGASSSSGSGSSGSNSSGATTTANINNHVKLDNQQSSSSSSSLQELMEIDQPTSSSTNTTSAIATSNYRDSSNHPGSTPNDITNDNSTTINTSSTTTTSTSTNNNNNNNNSNNNNNGNNNNGAGIHHLDQQILNKIDVNGDASRLIGGSHNFANGDNRNKDEEDEEFDINEAKFARLLQFGRDLNEYQQQLDRMYGKNEVNEKMLQDAISLIAYSNPKNSHLGKLLDPSEREPISQLLNSSIVKAEMGDSYRPPLEEVMNHLRKLVRLNDSHGRWLVEKLY